MVPKTLIEQKYELLIDYLKRNNKKLTENSTDVELVLRKHFDHGVSFKVKHVDSGLYYYADDISVDFRNNIVSVYYLESGESNLKKVRLKIN